MSDLIKQELLTTKLLHTFLVRGHRQVGVPKNHIEDVNTNIFKVTKFENQDLSVVVLQSNIISLAQRKNRR
jgi:hypothetical protein